MKFDRAKEVLERHSPDLGDDAETYIGNLEKEFSKLSTRSREDYREAGKMAVDASKTLFQIAIGVFIALGGFIQFALRSGENLVSWPVGLLVLAGILTFISMCVGFFAIGDTYKRAEGRQDADRPWGTEPIANKLFAQSLLGVGALVAFSVATALWNWSSDSQTGLTITLPQGAVQEASAREELVLSGNWTSLNLIQDGIFELGLGEVPEGETRVLRIRPH